LLARFTGSHLKVCSPDTAGKTCCSAGMEEAYRLKAKQDFKRMYLAVLKGFKEDSDPPLDEALRQHAADIHGKFLLTELYF
jgi:Glypican.